MESKMPMKQGYSKKTIGKNIAMEMKVRQTPKASRCNGTWHGKQVGKSRWQA
jgi:hypothetical protein